MQLALRVYKALLVQLEQQAQLVLKVSKVFKVLLDLQEQLVQPVLQELTEQMVQLGAVVLLHHLTA